MLVCEVNLKYKEKLICEAQAVTIVIQSTDWKKKELNLGKCNPINDVIHQTWSLCGSSFISVFLPINVGKSSIC